MRDRQDGEELSTNERNEQRTDPLTRLRRIQNVMGNPAMPANERPCGRFHRTVLKQRSTVPHFAKSERWAKRIRYVQLLRASSLWGARN
jgi:hypothetical protein